MPSLNSLKSLMPILGKFIKKNPEAAQALAGGAVGGASSILTGGDPLSSALAGAGVGYAGSKLGINPLSQLAPKLAPSKARMILPMLAGLAGTGGLAYGGYRLYNKYDVGDRLDDYMKG